MGCHMYREAVSEYLKALEIEKDDPLILYHLGVAYRSLGEDMKAREAFTRALARNQGMDESWMALGAIAITKGEFALAAEALRKVRGDKAGDPSFLMLKARALEGAGNKSEADLYYRRFEALVPDIGERRSIEEYFFHRRSR